MAPARLVQQLRQEIAGVHHTWIECAASPFFASTPFYTVTELLRSGVHFAPELSEAERLAGLERLLGAAGLQPAESVPLVAPLLGLALPETLAPSPLSPEQQRKRLLSTLVRWTLWVSAPQPTVVVIEDLHWADPSTLELIGLLDEQGANSRVLLIQTARPEFLPPWPPRAHHTRITLSRLGRRHARSLVERLTGPARSSEPVTEALLERADGVPLFLEELVRVVVEEALDGVAPATIPSTERELPGELEADRALFTVVAQRESQLDVLECLRQRELDLPLARAGLAPTDEPSPGAKPAPRRCDGGSQSPTSAPANPVRR